MTAEEKRKQAEDEKKLAEEARLAEEEAMRAAAKLKAEQDEQGEASDTPEEYLCVRDCQVRVDGVIRTYDKGQKASFLQSLELPKDCWVKEASNRDTE